LILLIISLILTFSFLFLSLLCVLFIFFSYHISVFLARGTNAGVRTSPWARRSVPVRAREPASRVWMSKPATGAAGYPAAPGPGGI